MTSLAQSYEYCRQVARSRARNFYYSFVLLSPPQRAAMCAVYAFMRYCDDLSDEPGANRASIEHWRADLDQALAGRDGDHPVWPALRDSVERFRIPPRYFHDMIDGVASDLEPRRFETFAELRRYCYQVASVAGLTAVHIFGFDSEAALPLAEECGIAFQLTNILRDIREDAGLGRLYLPLEDLRRFGVSEAEALAGKLIPPLRDLMRFEAERARACYNESRPLLDLIHAPSRPSLWALIEIYSRLLERIEDRGYDVFTGRVRLSALEKASIVAQALWRRRFGR
jgi:15-cis-phytoene synthase